MTEGFLGIAYTLGFIILGYWGAPVWIWTLLAASGLYLMQVPETAWILFFVVAAFFNIPLLRQWTLSLVVYKLFQVMQFIPKISETERDALRAGDVWVEGELFSGKPNFHRMMKESYPSLTKEEQAFMDGPVEELCKLVDDWKIWNEKEIPREVWDFIKKHKFLGMIIPKEYGGLGFSALAHSEVIHKLGSRSLPLCITVMVPNSLGPAELLNHYGTEEQKKRYLPKLATGEEIPCFALTEPHAGSDAGSLTSSGEVFKGEDGKLYLRLNWNKRWITLAAISTTLGLAFRLRDPNNYLGKGEDLGITCALVPSKTPGVDLTERHNPLGTPFYNCPTKGKDVVISVDQIIGGVEGAGRGWKMLMECLAAGRGISLPAQCTGGAKLAMRVASAHATVRKQFGVSIGKFEGIAEPLARIGGFTYLMEAARRYTLGAIDGGMKPPVVTAIAKYNFTELARKIINDAMDIQGGAGISEGPSNLLANNYKATPIGITVEGANIMTRSLIIFGQGAMRAHPYAYKEVDALENQDLKAFDRAFWGHIGHVIRNFVRAVVLSITRGWVVIPYRWGSTANYYRKLSWASASFAILADIAMGTLGGQLKMKEKLTGRFADILSWMYIGTAVLRRFEAEGRKKEDKPFLHYSMQYCFFQIQLAFDGIFANFNPPLMGWIFSYPLRWYSNLNTIGGATKDVHDFKIAGLIQKPGEQRDVRLTSGIYVPKDHENEALARLEYAFHLTLQSEAVSSKVRKAVKAKKLKKAPAQVLMKNALDQNIITKEEFDLIQKAEMARDRAVQVDSFKLKTYLGLNESDPWIPSSQPLNS